MPTGIISFLDAEHYRVVEDLWAELDRTFGVRAIYETPFPHFSYQVAEHYDVSALETALAPITAKQVPFEVMTTGLGIFTGEKIVLYVPVVRNQAINAFHRRIWRVAVEMAVDPWPYYEPGFWVPHITLGHNDIYDKLPEVIALLRDRAFNWRVKVDHVAFACEDPDGEYQICRLDFGG